jgi:hypothetical protein
MARRLTDSRPSGIRLAFTIVLAVVASIAVGCATSSGGGHDRTPDEEKNYGNLDDHTGEVGEEKSAPKPKDNVRQSAGDAERHDAPASQGDDVHAVLQLTIEDSELDPYLKLGEPGRFPLKVAGSAVPQGIALVKATKPVVLTSPPTEKKDPVLVITEIDIKGSSATVSYRYDVEHIRGTAYLKKTPHGWELSNSRIVEH